MAISVQHTGFTDLASTALRDVVRLSPAPAGVRVSALMMLLENGTQGSLALDLGEKQENISRALSGQVNSVRAMSIRERVAARWGLDISDICPPLASNPPSESQAGGGKSPKSKEGGV